MALAGMQVAMSAARPAVAFRLSSPLRRRVYTYVRHGYRSTLVELTVPQSSRHLTSFVSLQPNPSGQPALITRRLSFFYFPFSTASSKPTAVAIQRPRQKLKWRIIARIAFYLRIPFLVVSVYGIGYQQGIMDYSRDPEDMESRMLDAVLTSTGCTSPEDREKVLVANEGEWRDLLSKFRSGHRLHRAQDEERYNEEYRRMVMLHNTSVVGEKIVKVAQSFVKTKLMDVVKEATNSMPPEMLQGASRQELYQSLLDSEEVELWTKAQKHMEGAWRFVLIPSEVPNAFVSELFPKRIFITSAFFEQFIESQDELALVLGHEISHLILGHSSDQNSLQMAIRTLEILLLSLDPTEGLFSLAFMGALASIRNAIGAVYSRDNERSADELGIKLAAMSCYDTRAASKVFYKMHMDAVESGSISALNKLGLFSFFNSHPPSEERYHALLEESDEENRDKYKDTSCASLKKMFWGAINPPIGS